MHRVELLAQAVADNLRWCSVVCLSRPSVDRDGIWLSKASPHPLFPDVVTARPGVSDSAVLSRLAGRRRCSVKDSFAELDLGPEGFTALFDAQWIGRGPGPIFREPDTSGWSRVGSSREFAQWSHAAGLPVSLPSHILLDSDTTVLAAHRDGTLAAGFVASRTDHVVGVSNVWGSTAGGVWPSVIAAVRARFPGRRLVGYEHGVDLAAALDAGFEPLGPLRVWSRNA